MTHPWHHPRLLQCQLRRQRCPKAHGLSYPFISLNPHLAVASVGLRDSSTPPSPHSKPHASDIGRNGRLHRLPGAPIPPPGLVLLPHIQPSSPLLLFHRPPHQAFSPAYEGRQHLCHKAFDRRCRDKKGRRCPQRKLQRRRCCHLTPRRQRSVLSPLSFSLTHTQIYFFSYEILLGLQQYLLGNSLNVTLKRLMVGADDFGGYKVLWGSEINGLELLKGETQSGGIVSLLMCVAE